MNDSISRKAAIDALTDYIHNIDRVMGDGKLTMYDCKDAAESVLGEDELPSADVQARETAEWVYGEKDGADGWYCSRCGFHIPWYYDYYGLDNINFIRDFHTCPHCDAKMLKYTGMKGEWNG